VPHKICLLLQLQLQLATSCSVIKAIVLLASCTKLRRSSRRRQVKRARGTARRGGDVVFIVFCVSPFGSVPAIFLFATNKRTNHQSTPFKEKSNIHTVNDVKWEMEDGTYIQNGCICALALLT
jgi:hypothetical protein